MAEQKSHFTSDRRAPSTSSWDDSEDWEAGSSVGLDIVDQALIPKNTAGSYDFSSFDTSIWTTHNDASYDPSDEYISMVASNQQNGELEFDSGVPASPWFCEWDNIFRGGNYEFQEVLFYADAIGDGGDKNRTAGIGQAYRIKVNYNGAIGLSEVVDGGSNILAGGSTSTSTHTYRLEYDGGEIRFYVDGSEKINYSLSSPNTQHSKLYFKSVTGINSSSNAIDNVSIGSL